MRAFERKIVRDILVPTQGEKTNGSSTSCIAKVVPFQRKRGLACAHLLHRLLRTVQAIRFIAHYPFSSEGDRSQARHAQ
jgi:hypothetical protein